MKIKILLELLIVTGIILTVLMLGNFPRRYRYKQVINPIIAMVSSISSGLLYFNSIKISPELINKILKWIPGIFTHVDINSQSNENLQAFFLALFVMSTFAAVKLGTGCLFRLYLVVTTLRKKHSRKKRVDETVKPLPKTPTIAYQLDEKKEIVLREEWEFVFIFLRKFSWAVALITILTYIKISFELSGHTGTDWLKVPPMIILVLFVALEGTWYLNGKRSFQQKALVEGNDIQTKRVGCYKDLWEEYQQRWREKLLYAERYESIHRPTTKKENLISKLDSKFECMQEIMGSISNLIDEGYSLTAKDCHLIKELYEGRDIIIADPNYNHIAPIVVNIFMRTVRREKNILILIPYSNIEDSEYTETFKNWLGRWKQSLTEESSFGTPKFFSRTSHIEASDKILISTPEDLLDENIIKNEWFSSLKIIMIIDCTTIFSRNLTASSILLNILRQNNENIQSIVISDYRTALEPSVRRNLDIHKGNELKVSKGKYPVSSILIWQMEGEPTFQEKVFDGYIERHLGAEVILAVLPWRDRLTPIILTEQEKVPWGEYIEELENHKTSLKDNTIGDGIYAVQAFKQIKCSPVSYLAENSDRLILFARDRENNMITTLLKSITFADEEILAHIVSPPYLLRDYFISNFKYFFKTPLYPLTGKLMVSKFSLAYTLMERLVLKGIEERDLLKELLRVAPHTQNTRKALCNLFLEVLDIDIVKTSHLKIDPENVFTGEQFEKQYIFSLSSQIRNDVDTHWMRKITITNQFNNKLGEIYYDHLFQNYLPGQIHAFSEKPYRIENFDIETGTLRVSHTSPRDIISYSPQTCVILNHMSPPLLEVYRQKLEQDGILLERKLCEANFEIITEGYYYKERNNRKFNPLKPINRHYTMGRVLTFTFSPMPGEENPESNNLHQETVSSSLVILLKEVFHTLFPETHQYLFVCSNTMEKGLDTNNRIMFTELHDKMAPEITGIAPGVSNSINLLIFEDSHQDMGLLQSIFDEWDYVFRVLDDYICWALSADDPNNSKQEKDEIETQEKYPQDRINLKFNKLRYLKFDQDHIAPFINLKKTSTFLRRIIGINPITTARKNYFSPNKDNIITQHGSHQCDFCAAPLPSAQLERLPDGRERCVECSESAIDRLKDPHVRNLVNVLEEAVNYFKNDLNIKIPGTINVKFATAAEISKYLGTEFRPLPQFTPRVIGFAESSKNKHAIKIENGSPYHLTLATIVHEITYLWQKENLDILKIKDEQNRQLILKGHATWTELDCLRTKNMAQFYRQSTASREDKYGMGYKKIMKMLDENEGHQNPFEMLMTLYPLSN